MLLIKLSEKEGKENASTTMKTTDNASPSENAIGNITSDDSLSVSFALTIKRIAFEKVKQRC